MLPAYICALVWWQTNKSVQSKQTRNFIRTEFLYILHSFCEQWTTGVRHFLLLETMEWWRRGVGVGGGGDNAARSTLLFGVTVRSLQLWVSCYHFLYFLFFFIFIQFRPKQICLDFGVIFLSFCYSPRSFTSIRIECGDYTVEKGCFHSKARTHM